ncbi:MAG: ROK family protein [Eubacterium sp.]
MLEQDTLKNIRNKNIADILQVLRSEQVCTLSRLTEKTEGGLTTVKKCVQQAMDYSMIIKSDIADSTGGRKASRYLLNPEYQYFLMVFIDNKNLLCKAYNFNYELVDESSEYFEMNGFFNCFYTSVDSYIRKYNIGTICLSLSCIVKDGVILDWYYNPRLNGFDIKGDIESRYDLNVIVQNDMKLTVIGESSRGINNISTMQFGHNGIGVGEMINGRVVEGFSGFAGEVSYFDDIRKSIKGVGYFAKIVRNVIICTNPEIIVFYQSDSQKQFNSIFNSAIKNLPSYAVPKFEVSDDYIGSMIKGFKLLIDKYGYFRKREKNYE